MNPNMTIGKLAKAADVAIDTVRYYERQGLLPQPQRTTSGYRLYAEDSLRRLRFIRRAKALGFQLNDIASLLRLTDNDGASASVRALTLQHLDVVNRKIEDLLSVRDALQTLAARCDGEGCIHHCPIIDALNNESGTPA